jgi:pyruvate formate lyase activating enzyme
VSKTEGLVFDIRKFSLHDGPGIRTTVFFKGCPLSCWWCHNPESQSPKPEIMLWESRCIRCGACIQACPQGAVSTQDGRIITDRERCTRCGTCTGECAADARELIGKRMSVNEVMREIERDVVFFEDSGGGVTFSGGEPLAQRAFLAELLRACHALEIHTAVDTCGYTPWEALDSIRADTDLFLYDLKLMDDTRHRLHTGVSNRLILDNLQALSASGARIIVRMPVIPGINDSDDDLHHLGAFAAVLPHLERLDILPYHHSALGKYERLDKAYPMPESVSPTDERMQEIARLLQTYDLSVKIGG